MLRFDRNDLDGGTRRVRNARDVLQIQVTVGRSQYVRVEVLSHNELFFWSPVSDRQTLPVQCSRAADLKNAGFQKHVLQHQWQGLLKKVFLRLRGRLVVRFCVQPVTC